LLICDDSLVLSVEFFSLLLKDLSTHRLVLVDTVRIKFSTTTLTAQSQFRRIIFTYLNSILTVHFFNAALLKLVASLGLLPSIFLLALWRRLLLLQLSIHGRFGVLVIVLFLVSRHVLLLFVLTWWLLISLSHSFRLVIVILLFIILIGPLGLVIVILLFIILISPLGLVIVVLLLLIDILV
jgi:hypothetical protein